MSRHHYRIRCRRPGQTRPPPKTPSTLTHWASGPHVTKKLDLYYPLLLLISTLDLDLVKLGRCGGSALCESLFPRMLEYWRVEFSVVRLLTLQPISEMAVHQKVLDRRHDCRAAAFPCERPTFYYTLSPGTESPLAALINFQF